MAAKVQKFRELAKRDVVQSASAESQETGDIQTPLRLLLSSSTILVLPPTALFHVASRSRLVLLVIEKQRNIPTTDMAELDRASSPNPSVLAHVVDVHCHPTDSPVPSEVMDQLSIRICAMSTRASDQPLVRDLANKYPAKVIPCFGYHPWFSHWIAIDPFTSKEDHYRHLLVDPSKSEHAEAFDRLLPYLPDPTPLSDMITSLRSDLQAFPHSMLGEVGLDRSARIPFTPPSPVPYALHDPEKKELSPFTVPLEHQLKVIEAQLELAVELGRNISMHSVKAQQATVDLLDRMAKRFGEKWTRVSIDLHSCGLSAQTWRDIERKHPNAFLSLSTAINSRSPAHKTLVAACSPTRILVESDFNDIRPCAMRTWDMLCTVAEVKGWSVEEQWDDEAPDDRETWGAVRRLEENWKRFEKGGHLPAGKKPSKRQMQLEDWEEEE
ncbi:hypothetical protein EIP91_004570 [Steccherinum ochraceum]|uniref:TatD DNase n=1 Tax=Steccherinum ochraceum TaxID=92696 RepID=A0A4R0R995_9APHY|nr:hypothetical protein EIP91_004570 [Steccherinum ochraceum]